MRTIKNTLIALAISILSSSALVPSAALACSVHGMVADVFGLVAQIEPFGDAVRVTVPGFQVEAVAGDTCFVAVAVQPSPNEFLIDSIDFVDATGVPVDFSTFILDRRMTRKLNTSGISPPWLAFTASTQSDILGLNQPVNLRIGLAVFDSFGPPPEKLLDKFAAARIATGQIDGQGNLRDHAAVVDIIGAQFTTPVPEP